MFGIVHWAFWKSVEFGVSVGVYKALKMRKNLKEKKTHSILWRLIGL